MLRSGGRISYPQGPSYAQSLIARSTLATASRLLSGMNRSLSPGKPLTLLLAAIIALLSDAGPAAAAPRYDWPVAAPHDVTRPFDPPSKPWLPGHRGVDLASADGATVLAAGDGTVAFAGPVAGKPVVSIDHGGIRTTYEPVVATVSAGDVVVLGQHIGTLVAGHPECAVAACLHWGAKRGEKYVDPLSLLRPRRVRLLPL